MFKRTKGLPTAAVVLGLLLAASPTLAGPGRREGRPGGMGGDLRRALAALDLTEDQKTKMKELFENGRQRRETLRQEGRTAREALRAAAGAAAPDPAAVGAAFLRLKAHREAASALRPGVAGREVDAVARKVIADAGYGKDFVHGLGHGLGLEIHEAPRLSALSGDTLQVGDVVTIEPGIYIEGRLGVRIEDCVVVTEDGMINFATASKELLTIE